MPANKAASRPAAGSLHEILAESEFRGMLDKEMRGLFECYAVLDQTPKSEWAKRHFHWIHQEADHLETFLDDHGARTNRVFRRFREIVAGIRGFAEKCHVLGHLDQRIGQYSLALKAEDTAAFVSDLRATQAFAIDALGRLYKELADEARRVGCTNPPTVANPRRVDPVVDMVRKKLPNNIDDATAGAGEGRHIVELSTSFMAVEKDLAKLGIDALNSAADVEAFVRSSFSEAFVRNLETRIHNLQAKYDTYVRNTPEEHRLEELPLLRGHVSAALHLTECATRLVHFYERHESDLRPANQSVGIAEIVRKDVVLDRAVRFALRWAKRFMALASPFAERLLSEFTQLQSVELVIPDGVLLHARPASLIVSIVNHHGVPVEMEIDGECANAGSIMQVMILAGSKVTARRVTFRGDVKPLRDLELLFGIGLGEKGLDDLPNELSYLGS